MTTNWQEKAKEAVDQSYQPGNNWESMLRRHLNRCFPDLVKELGDDLEAYLRATTFEAMLMCERLEDQGTPTDVAEELARDQLLQRPPDEQERTTQAEMEDSVADQEAAALQALLRSPSTSPLPRQIPLT